MRPSPSLLSLAGFALLCWLSVPALAQAPKPAAAEKPPAKPSATLAPLPSASVTHHKIKLAGGMLSYTATAGALPLTNDQGEKEAEIFYVAFLRDGVSDEAKRPITYAFNGGPGAASAYLDIGALGPRAIDFAAGGRPTPTDARVADNPATWLPFTDLVFIDPVGTGYSRAASDEAAKRLWSVGPDLDALAQIIRLHLVRAGRLASPVYLAGESYGGFRAARLAGILAQREGIAPAGIVLISPALEFELMDGDRFDLLSWGLRLPSYAAVELAAHHALSAAALAPAERFALGDYLVGLAAAPGDRPKDFYPHVAGLIGIDEAIVARWRGRVPPSAYAKARRRSEGEIVSRYDATIAAPDPDPPSAHPEVDPVLEGTIAPFTRAFTAYVRDELGYRTDLRYTLLSEAVAHHWQWRYDGAAGRSELGSADALARALALEPQLKLLIAHGLTDLVTPYMMSRYIVDHLPDNVTGERIALKLYPGGHMMYLRQDSRRQLHDDAAAFYGAK